MNLLWKAFFSALWSEILKPLIRIAVSKLGGAITDAAKSAVASVQADPALIRDADKRDKALEILKDKLLQDGREISDSLGNLFIELAVQAYKKRWS